MLTVEEYCKIRIAHRDGMSIRQIARRFHHSRRKVRQVLEESEPRPYTLPQDRPAPQLGPYKALIEQILAEDQQAPRKQQHTAAKLYRRLRDEHGYPGGYDQVRRYVGQLGRAQRETFIPLTHPPGRRLEADFGHIYVDFPEGRRQVSVLLLTWSHSGYRFAVALPSEQTEAILAGMVQGFEFFGCVPWEVWWDNPTTVATAVLEGRQRKVQPRYAALASHYCFDPRFCMPARGNEKPYVEHSVYDLQRDWATPVPRMQDLAELNAYLRSCALAKRDHTMAGKTQTIGELFEQDKQAALALPPRAFDPFVPETAKVDKYQTVRFDTNRYSVPRRWAFETVTIKAYVDRIEVVSGTGVIARHARSYARGRMDRATAALPGDPRSPAGGPGSFLRVCRLETAGLLRRVAGRLRDAGRAGRRRTAVRAGSATAGRIPGASGSGGHHPQPASKTTVNADHIIATVRRLGDRPVTGEADPRPDTQPVHGRSHLLFPHWTISICYYPKDKETSMTMENERRLLAVHLKRLRLPDDPGRVRETGPGGGSGERPLPAVLAAVGGVGVSAAWSQRSAVADQAGGVPGL